MPTYFNNYGCHPTYGYGALSSTITYNTLVLSSSAIMVKDENVVQLTQSYILNFIGSGVRAAPSTGIANQADVQIDATFVNGFTGSILLLAGPNIAINSGSNGIVISGTTDLSPLNQFSQSVNNFTATLKLFTQSFFIFSASQLLVNLTQSLLNLVIGGFTASFSSSVQFIGDARYVQNINTLSGTVRLLAGPNVVINSDSNSIYISASAATTSINTFSGAVNILAGENTHISSSAGDITISSDSSFVPYFIEASETFKIPVNKQALKFKDILMSRKSTY